MKIGERIKEARKKAHFTQKALGEKLGVSAAMIAQYENGTRIPKVNTLIRISDALGVSIVSLFDNTMWDIPIEDMEELKRALQTDRKSVYDLKKKRIIAHFMELNDKGQDKAIEQVELLTKIPEYRKDAE